MDYPGKVITKTQVTPTQTSASGNWTLDDQAAAIKNNNWPVALVPNPISKSLRFNSADSAYLNRTPSVAGNRQIFTWSGWIKRSAIAQHVLFSAPDGSGYFRWEIDNGANQAEVIAYNGTSITCRYTTPALFRDPSAWYHFVFAIDTTQATSTNRVKIYVNGAAATVTQTTAITQNTNTPINSTVEHAIGRSANFGPYYFSGYMTEVNFIDGQALTPSSFGMTNPQTGQWIPLKYSGTYGTNGFYLNFKDATSTTTLGYDYSGNANNWTTNNFSVTAGAGNDSLTDVPTPWIAYNTTGDVGGVFRGNYCTLNPLQNNSGVLTNGNLDFADAGSDGWNNSKGTIGVSSGKFYWEMTANNVVSSVLCASVGGAKEALGQLPGQNDSFGVTYYADGRLYYNGTSTGGWGSSYTNGDVIGIALDMDNGKVWFSKNGTWQASGDPATGANAARSDLKTNDDTWFPMSGTFYAATTCTFNFGQRPFAYTPPTGFRSLCTTNLPATAIGFGLTNQGDDYFNAVLYTGNGTSQTIDTGLQPDFIWIKRRNGAAAHTLTDSVRGISKQLFSNLTDAEQTDADSGVTAISSSSITLGDNNLAVGSVNGSGSTYVAWNWKAGGTGVTNTAGTITSTVSANTTAGFSVVTYTGNNTASTVGHGLGVAPSMYIVKLRSTTGAWGVYHSSLTAGQVLYLNLTDAVDSSAIWNSTAPTSTVFSVGAHPTSNPSGQTLVAYCFATVPGYSAFGSYTGNGSTDGPFVYTGFRPAWVMFKNSAAVSDWWIYDTKRNTYNVMDLGLRANLSDAELTYAFIDCLSNGFKLRNTGGDGNRSGEKIIYAAFAESPFQFANAR